LGQTVGSSGADGAGTAHDHVVNRKGGLTKVRRGDDAKLVGKQPLLDQQHFIARSVKGYGAEMLGAASKSDNHADRSVTGDHRLGNPQSWGKVGLGRVTPCAPSTQRLRRP